MILADVQDDLRPAVEAALDKGLDYFQIKRAFSLMAVKVALERNDGSQLKAAVALRVSHACISLVVKDGKPRGRRHWKKHGDLQRMNEFGEMPL